MVYGTIVFSIGNRIKEVLSHTPYTIHHKPFQLAKLVKKRVMANYSPFSGVYILNSNL